jgi:hypothetical protein
MEQKAVPLPAQFGSFVVPAARAISAPSSFVGVTFQFVGRVTSILDSGAGARGPNALPAVYSEAPAATLTVGSSFAESLPFAQSLPGFEMVVEKDTGGHSLNFESDFSLVKGPLFPTNVEVAMVIALAHSAGVGFLRDAAPSSITLHDFDDTHFLITFFDTASGSVSFLEVELERFTARTFKRWCSQRTPRNHKACGVWAQQIACFSQWGGSASPAWPPQRRPAKYV